MFPLKGLGLSDELRATGQGSEFRFKPDAGFTALLQASRENRGYFAAISETPRSPNLPARIFSFSHVEQLKSRENCFPSHLDTERQIEASGGGGRKSGGAGRGPETQSRCGSGPCAWKARHVRVTQMARKLILK